MKRLTDEKVYDKSEFPNSTYIHGGLQKYGREIYLRKILLSVLDRRCYYCRTYKKVELRMNAMKRVGAGAYLPNPWLFESVKRPDDRADNCLGKRR